MSQRTMLQQYCKNNHNEAGVYFLSDQPWVKFCKQCALNMALYGKKIDKDLTTDQFERKSKLETIRECIKKQLLRIEGGNEMLTVLTNKIEGASKSEISEVVRCFDEYVKHLCEVRDQMIEIFQSSFPQSSQAYFERQTKILLAQIQLKNNIKQIQVNYRNFIQAKQESNIQQKIIKWGHTLSSLDRLLPKDTEEKELDDFMTERTHQIRSKLLSVEPFNLFLNDAKNRLGETRKVEMSSVDLSSCVSANEFKKNRKATLKLRSRSKKTQKNQDKDKQKQNQSMKTRKSVKDVSSLQMMETFHI